MRPSWRTRASVALGFSWVLTIAIAIAASSGTPDTAWRLDDTFGTDGEVVTKFGSGFDEVFGVAVGSQGTIYAAGDATLAGGSTTSAVAAYNADGTLHQGFGGTGTDTGGIPGSNSGARAIAVESGEIAVAGFSSDPSNGTPQLAVVTYGVDGSVHDHFEFSELQFSEGTSVAIYPPTSPNAGQILVGGYVNDPTFGKQFLVVRLTVDPSLQLVLDTTFGDGFGYGILATGEVGDNVVHSLAIQSDGKIVAVGTSNEDPNGVGRMEMFRLLPDGELDQSFGGQGDGFAFHKPCDCAGWAVGLRPDGMIVAVGQTNTLSAYDMYGRIYTDKGLLTKEISADFFDKNDVARAVVFQPGKMVLVGWAAESGTGASTNDLVFFALARFNNDGSRDASFGDDSRFSAGSNKVVAGFAFGYDAALAAVVQEDGDIVAGGGTNQAQPGLSDLDFGLARFTGPGGTGPPGFKAKAHDLPAFELEAKPETFSLHWSAVTPPADMVTFDVRTRTARYYQGKYEDWQIILTKTAKTSKEIAVTPGTTICFEVRAHSAGFTTPWSAQQCTATPVDDATMTERPPRAWGDFKLSNCYRNTYTGNGGGTGAELTTPVEGVFRDLAVVVAKGDGFGTIAVRVNGKTIDTVSLQAASTKCAVLVPVHTYQVAARRDVDIVVEKSGKQGVFVDGLGMSFN